MATPVTARADFNSVTELTPESKKPTGRKRMWAVLTTVLVGCLGVGVGVGVGLAWHDLTSGSKSGTSSSTGAPANITSTANPDRRIFYIIGDSVTQYASDPSNQGYAARLQNEYVRSVDVLNRGLTSYNTKAFVSTVLPLMNEELDKYYSPALITLWLGVNDATLIGGRHQGQHVPLDQYRDNMVTIVKDLQKHAPNAKMILLTPAPVDDSQRLADALKSGFNESQVDRSNNATEVYVKACREVMNYVDNVKLVDVYKYMMETYPNATERGALQADGVHFNAEGHKVIYELLKKEIEIFFPGLTYETLQIPDFHKLNDYYPGNQNTTDSSKKN